MNMELSSSSRCLTRSSLSYGQTQLLQSYTPQMGLCLRNESSPNLEVRAAKRVAMGEAQPLAGGLEWMGIGLAFGDLVSFQQQSLGAEAELKLHLGRSRYLRHPRPGLIQQSSPRAEVVIHCTLENQSFQGSCCQYASLCLHQQSLSKVSCRCINTPGPCCKIISMMY
jgi:hypothetical protein